MDLFPAVCHILLLSALLASIANLACENLEIPTIPISVRHCFWNFMLVWLVARHDFYLTVTYSIYADILEKSPTAATLTALSTSKALSTLRADLRTLLIHLEIREAWFTGTIGSRGISSTPSQRCNFFCAFDSARL